MKKSIIFILTFLIFTATSIAENISNEAKLMYNHGLDLYKIGQHEKAIECFRKSIETDPNYIDAYYNLGTVLEFLKQYDAALVVFKQIIVRCPDDYESVYKAALLSIKLKDNESAKKYLSIIPKDSPEGKEAEALAKTLITKPDPSVVQKNTSDLIPGKTCLLYDNIPGPTGITSDNTGNTYIASFSDNSIMKITPEKSRLLYSKSPKINGPIGITMDESGNLYIANYNDNNILKISKTGIASILITQVNKPYGIYFKNGILYISLQGSNSVIQYKLPQ